MTTKATATIAPKSPATHRHSLNPPLPQSPDPQLPALRQSILSSLARALHAASHRLAQRAAGQSVFTDDADLKSTLAILRTLPQVLAHIPEPPPPPPAPAEPKIPSHFNAHIDKTLRDLTPEQLQTLVILHWHKFNNIPLIPICPICLQGPGGHWVERCPDRKPEHDIQHLKKLQNNARVR